MSSIVNVTPFIQISLLREKPIEFSPQKRFKKKDMPKTNPAG
jgi:hypothetical protein